MVQIKRFNQLISNTLLCLLISLHSSGSHRKMFILFNVLKTGPDQTRPTGPTADRSPF